MKMVSQTEAVGSRWAANPLGWAILLVPTTLLVVIQDATTPFPSAIYLLGSSVAQHVVGGGAAIALIALLRLLWPVVPVPLVFAVWTTSGVLRGLVGGWIAHSYGGVDPEYLFRIAFWVATTLVWIPLFTYLFAQLELRRTLLAELASMLERLNVERDRAHHSATRLTAELVSTVRDAIGPLIQDVRTRLALAAAQDQEIPLEPISDRLEFIATETRAMIDHPDDAGRRAQPAASPLSWSPLLESVTFERSRPFFASALSALAVSALIVPDAVRAGGFQDLFESIVAVLAGAITMWIGLVVAARARQFTAPQVVLVFIMAGVGAVLALLAVETYPLPPRDLALALALPLAFTVSATTLSATMGVARANLNLVETVAARKEELAELHEHSRVREERITRQVNEILHGPILGRLSACVMALNFFLTEPNPTRGLRRRATTEGVLAHLELISEDLEKLSRSAGRTGRTL